MAKLEVQIKDNKIFSPLRNKWLELKPEEEVRQNFVCRLVNFYGYNLDQMMEELTVSQYSSRGNGQARADIVIWRTKEDKINDEEAFIVVECKAEHVKIHSADYFQGLNYAKWVGAQFFITTNQKETKFFKVPKRLPNKLDEIVDIPTVKEAPDDKKVEEISNRTKTFERDEFSKLLFKCHNIIRNNDKLSPEAAFDEISKILFMKIRYERQQDKGAVFSLERFKEGEKFYNENIRPTLNTEEQKLSYMQREFIQTKREFEDDKLFEAHETIKIKQYSFEQIIKELQKYNLSATDDDVKGIAFEQFLGSTFRGELGQFFTPRTIVDFMVDVLDPQEGEIICDPTCGSGGFLIKAFEYIREKIENDIQKEKENIKTILFDEKYEKASILEQEEINKLVSVCHNKLSTEILVPNKKYKNQTVSEKNRRISKLSSSCIYGTDANPRMARTSKMNMIMHGDGHGGVHHHDGLINVNGIFEDRFDVILTNPPFGARIEKDYRLSETDKFYNEEKLKEYEERYGEKCLSQIKELNESIDNKQRILERFNLGKVSGLTEVLFMERCLKLLKPGGRMGIVLPEGVLNNSNLQKVRDYFESKAKILLITSIPSDVFVASGATIKPSLLFFKRFTEDEEKQYKDIELSIKKEIKLKYQDELNQIITKFTGSKKEQNKKIKEIENKKQNEFETTGKQKIKELFNYEIPIVEVKEAGINKIGGKCNNELIDVAKEFKNYRDLKGLWTVNKPNITYKINGEKLIRITNGIEEVIDE